jgi:hypothetical protein
MSLRPGRLVYATEMPQAQIDKLQDSAFKDKVQENYDQKISKLADEIKDMEKKGKSDAEIRQELKDRRQKMVVDAINQALVDQKIKTSKEGKLVQATYADLLADKNAGTRSRGKDIFEEFDNKGNKDIDAAVDRYNDEKIAASGKARGALSTLPKPTERVDLDEQNKETASMQEMLDKRRGAMDKSRQDRADLFKDRSINYRARTAMADTLTDTKSGVITNYDDGWTGNTTDENSPTHMRLNGYLYAHDIFMGADAENSKQIMSDALTKKKDEKTKTPMELYEDRMPDRLDMSDLDVSLGLQNYYGDVKTFSTFDRVIGTMETLLKLTDETVADKDMNKRYKDHLFAKFGELGDPDRKNNEERQIQHLYTIKTLSEFFGSDPKWKTQYAAIDKMTDPERDGDDVIDDYPDWSLFGKDENKENPTRYALNGYLFSVYLFSGRNQNIVQSEYKRAYNMFDNASTGKMLSAGTIFEQDMLERDAVAGDKAKDGFGLKQGLIDAGAYTKSDMIKGVIAGLLKQTDDISDEAKRKNYRKYVDGKLKNLDTNQTEETQLSILSGIPSPEEAEKELKNELHAKLLENVIEATKQHNQFKLSSEIKANLDKDPKDQPVSNLENYFGIVKRELDAFVKTRADADEKDLENKYNLLVADNTKLKEPRFNTTEMDPLRDSIKKNHELFGKARAIATVSKLEEAVSNKHLKDLSDAEKEYFDLAEQLDKMLADVHEQAKSTLPEPLPPTPVPVPEPGPGPGPDENTDENIDDPVKAHWANAERVPSQYGDYVGPMIVDSGANDRMTIARTTKGDILTEIPNGKEIMRTAKDSLVKGRNVDGVVYILVHLDGKLACIPELQLFKKDDYEAPPLTTTTPENPPAQKKSPESPVNQPGSSPSHYDQTFNRVSQEVENNVAGSFFQLEYNGVAVSCLVQKQFDGYHLLATHPEAGTVNVAFGNVQQIRNYVEGGNFYQLLAVQSLQKAKNWDRLKDGTWKPEIKQLKQTGANSLFVELDWKRNNAFETGNAKIDLDVNPDGRIHYRIHKDYVGPNNEDVREGYVSDMMQLQQALSHSRTWAEAYRSRKNNEHSAEKFEREVLLTNLMNPDTFSNMSSRIGENYYFRNFYLNGYACMYLDWDGTGDVMSRDRSLNNPILEVKLNADNTINWKLTNQSGPGNAWVGLSGQARDIGDLGRQVEQIRKNPSAVMTTPWQNLLNLGNYGRNLYY